MVFGALAAWLALGSSRTGTSGLSGGGVVLAAFALFVFGRVASFENGWELALGVAGGGLAVIVGSGDSLLENTTGPIGYANATAAVFLLAAAAGLLVAVRAPVRKVRIAGFALAAAFASIPLSNGSRTAAALLFLLPLGLLAGDRPEVVRRLLALGLGAVVLVIALTTWLGVRYEPTGDGAPLDRLATGALSERRVSLWHDAITLLREDPLLGGGPGSFAVESPTAQADADSRWAHSAYLQLAAEAGLPAMALLLAVVVWGFVQLARSELDAGAAIAGMALTASAVHAAIDYVWSFPAVLLTLALVLGVGMGAGRERS